MLILTVAIGNAEEAFIQKTPFSSSSINIISSDDNNRGKTILIQSMMYCLGNVPTFPSSFEYKNYYYIVEFQIQDKNYLLCRKDNNFIIKEDTSISFFNNLSEFKRYWNKFIFLLPTIKKNGESRIVDPELFLQLFFVGQDKKDSSNIINKGFYNKDDFYNMLCSMLKLDSEPEIDEELVLGYKKKIKELKYERSILLKKNKILKSPEIAANYLSIISDRNTFESQLNEIKKIKEQIAIHKKARNTAINRKLKYEISIKEIMSLNRTIDKGELQCLDCGSLHIGFKSTPHSTFSFDISTPEIRKDILESLNEKVLSYQEEVDRITYTLNMSQIRLQSLLGEESISLEALLAYEYNSFDLTDLESKIIGIEQEINELSNILESIENRELISKQERQTVVSNIIKIMNDTYKKIDPSGNLFFDDIFSTKGTIYSGSEAIIFYLVKLYAIAKVLKHDYPIIVDSFRADDLSSNKEDIVLELFSDLNLQIIFTTTLKQQEIGKYDGKAYIHHIDFTPNAPSKILNQLYISDFKKILSSLSLKIM